MNFKTKTTNKSALIILSGVLKRSPKVVFVLNVKITILYPGISAYNKSIKIHYVISLTRKVIALIVKKG